MICKEPENTINMDVYYIIRSEFRKLYNDVTTQGDLYGSVLGIRDKNKRYINTAAIDTGDYSIYIELVENITDKNKLAMINQVTEAIRTYLLNNIDKIYNSIPQYKNDALRIINSQNYAFCDVSTIGNNIVIML